MEDSRPVLAVDVGGTKMAVGLVEPAGRVLTWSQVPTPTGLDAEQLWRTLDALITKILDDAAITDPGQLAGCGCGCGGPMDWPSGVVSPLNIPGWRAFPLRHRLEERLPGITVRVHNDAICMVAAEHWRGAGRGRDNVLGMVVSTGVGGGLVLDGRLIAGASGNAGHIGHVVVDPDTGPPCACGGRGCAEAIARGPALVTWAQGQGWRPDQKDATAKDLAADGAQGHPVGIAAMRRAGRALGIAIASATVLCDLEVVSVGGGLSQAGPLLFDPLEEALRAHARLEFARQVRVVPAALGQSAGLVGAAALIFAGGQYWAAD
ncbi:MAG TPA: ROK family protein [Streptosporangiaceae bacterium]|jgi:glucokinase|nr:ROK family protein [Streptosporangiaceae bacterium]